MTVAERLGKDLSAFRLDPDANIQITFSMGGSSALKTWAIAEANGGIAPNWQVLCENTGFEREASLDFWSDFQHHTGIAVKMLERRSLGGFEIVGHNSLSRNGEPFRELVSEPILRRDGTIGPRPLPNDGPRRLCSGELKTKTAHRYLRSLGWSRYYTTLGFRADEPQRVDRRKKFDAKQAGKAGVVEGGLGLYPLFDAGVSKADVLRFWGGETWDAEEIYGWKSKRAEGFSGDAIPWRLKIPSWQSNCDNCFMAAEITMKERMALDPNGVDPWAEMEGVDRGVDLRTGKPRNNVFRPGRKTMEQLRGEVLAGDMSVDPKALKRRPKCGTCSE